MDNQRTRGLEQGRERNNPSIQMLQQTKFVLEMRITVTVRSFMHYQTLLIPEEEFESNNLEYFRGFH